MKSGIDLVKMKFKYKINIFKKHFENKIIEVN